MAACASFPNKGKNPEKVSIPKGANRVSPKRVSICYYMVLTEGTSTRA